MKPLYIYTKALIICAGLSLLSVQCERFVEVDDPTNQVSQNTVFGDKVTATSALADVYDNLRSNSVLAGNMSGAGFLTGLYTDELSTVTTNLSGFREFYDLSLQTTSSDVDYLWVTSYRNIYAANNIIQGVEQSTAYLDEGTRNTLTGEALAIRAILHLYLSGLFGEIPYIESTDYRTNQSVKKNTLPQIYSKLKTDLQLAESLLSTTYPSPDRTRINKTAVQLLLARFYLYDEDYANARHYAGLVTGNTAYSLEPSLDQVFLKGAKSTIWQFAPIEAGANTLEGQTYIIQNTPPPNAFLNEALLQSFEPGDMRLTRWTGMISSGGSAYGFPYKYKQYTKTPASQEYSVILRIEEAYLIAAEAENKLGNQSGALQKLSVIRSRAGLTTPATAPAQSVDEMIVRERRHELFTEGSHRFFDLKRWGVLNTTMQALKPEWQPYMQYLPLPQRELLVNPNLNPQNDGY